MFHANFRDFAGGFVGVDVFFVISGYLIIPQLAERIASDDANLADFFGRRIRRLFPALVPVLLYAFIAGALLLGQGEFRSLIDTLLGAATYVSNFVLLSQSGYFARANDSTFLLHTWSLGVEFQFYMLVPFFLLALSRYKTAALFIAAAASFLFATYLVWQGSDRAFYGFLPRFWELAVGGMLGLIQSRVPVAPRVGIILRIFGLSLIGMCATVYTEAMPFPGPAALVPVTGAALILVAAPARRDPVLWLLNSRVMQWVGTRSYSIYLWHWPIIVTVTLVMVKPSDGHYAAVLLLSFLLAELSFRFVEAPVRRKPRWRKMPSMVMLSGLPVAVGAVLWGITAWPNAYETVRTKLPLANYRIIRDFADGERDLYMATVHNSLAPEGVITRGVQCSYDDTADIEVLERCLAAAGYKEPVLVIGDSQGRDVYHALRQAFPARPFLLLHQSGCAPVEQPEGIGRACFRNLSQLLPRLISNLRPSSLVLASSWPVGSPATVTPTIELIRATNTPVAVVGAGPVFRTLVPNQLRAIDVTSQSRWDDIRVSSLDQRYDVVGVNRQLAAVARAIGIPFIDRYAEICDAESCRAFVPKKNRLMIWDNQHLTISGIQWLGNALRDSLDLQRLF